MGLFARSGILLGLIALLSLICAPAKAETLSILIHCMRAMVTLQQAHFKAKKVYEPDANRLRAGLTPECASRHYGILIRKPDSVTVFAKRGNETWSINEKDELVRLSRDNHEAQSALNASSVKPGGKAPPLAAPTGNRVSTVSPVQQEPEDQVPRPPTSEEPTTLTQPSSKPGEPEHPMRVRLCKSKQLSQLPACVKILAEVEKKCQLEPTAAVCDEYYGQATPLTPRPVARLNCTNPLNWLKAECHDPASVKVKPERSPATNDPPRVEGSASAVTGRATESDRTSMRYMEKVNNLSSSLQTLLKLRPVSFDWRDSRAHDIGFVAEEVALLDSRLASYNNNGRLEGVKYGHITALLTAGVQELHGMCRDGITLQKHLLDRVEKLEETVTQLREVNAKMREVIINQELDLKNIKSKLGLK